MIDLKQEIMKTLRNTFNLPARGETNEQNFKEESFSVREIEQSHHQQIGEYQRTSYLYEIKYFPSNDRANKTCREMGFNLMRLFRFYEDMKLHPTSMSHRIINNVLQFNIGFDIRYKFVDAEGEKFTGLEIRSDLKDG